MTTDSQQPQTPEGDKQRPKYHSEDCNCFLCQQEERVPEKVGEEKSQDELWDEIFKICLYGPVWKLKEQYIIKRKP